MSDYANALPDGFRLHEYEVVRVLGYGGFGITYLGYDHHLDKAVAIKEFLPPEMATRHGDHSVVAHSTGHQSDFRWGLERFLEEARTLARFDDRHIVKVYRFFEAHGTGYIVMEYAEGEPLSERLRRCGRLSEDEFKSLLLPILSGLERVHEASFLHRDIKPGNIMIRADGSPVLIDFGAARQAVGAKSRSVTSIVTPGYAPIEQYSTKGHQGPWTDIYALGAVGYRALTGRDPEDATERVRNDPLEPLSSVCRGEASETFLKAIDWALSVDEGDRPQDVAVFRAALLGDAVPAGAGAVQSGRSGAPEPTPSAAAAGSGAARPKTVVWVLVGAGVIGLAVLLGWLARDDEPPAVAQTQEPSVRSEPLSPGVPAAVERREVATPAPQAETPAPSVSATPPAAVAAAPATYALTVAAEPGDARIRVLNIGPRYQAGMQLEPGRYHIEVSKEGYQTHREWLELVDRDLVQRVSLSEVRQVARPELTGELVDIPGGTFRMGDLIGDGEPRERPVRTVTIRPFRMGKTEVTRGQFRAFVNATNYRTDAERDHGNARGCFTFEEANWKWEYRAGYSWRDPGFPQTDAHPVVCVSSNDVKAYLEWLNRETGLSLRLPSEAEWEYAARAGSASRYPWGMSADAGCRYANGADETASPGKNSRFANHMKCSDGYFFTAPVGNYAANEFGLHDMVGNVWEWTEDCANDSYQGAPTDGRAWLSGDCSRRVARGGGWNDDAARLRGSYRARLGAAGRAGGLGFRLAQDR